jgi:tetratricopeptide (TPR) repeat protein
MPRRSKAEELLEFEIAFYEKLFRAYPDFIDVLIPLANAYTRRGLFEKGLQIDLRLTQLRGNDPVAWYNLACSHSLLKHINESVAALRRSVELGYRDVTHLKSDPDLVNLRQSEQYRQFLESLATLAEVRARPLPPDPVTESGNQPSA